MGKLKPRLKGKGKRWPKGQSSSCNPSITKFREAAKSKFFTPNLGTSRALTVGALKAHNSFSTAKTNTVEPSEISDGSVWSDVLSEVSTATFKTFASEWSLCSNMSFSKLLNNFSPNSAIHKEMLAVLAAVTEVIKSNGGSETSTEYFAALMTALENNGASEDTITGIINLLAMVIKSVPQEVLRSKFSQVSKALMDILVKYSDSENFVIIRNVIGCLSVLLRAQDLVVWSYPSTHQVFQTILVFSVHSKPKVRKAGQYAVMAILKGSTLIESDATHPAAADAAKFCIQKIENGRIDSVDGTILHVLTLLKEIISSFPKSQIKATCEGILKLLTVGNVLLTSCCFQALHGLFSSKPPITRLTPTLNAQIIHALYDYQPPVSDFQAVLAWLAVMQEAFTHLARIDSKLFAENLGKLFNVVIELWLCDNSKVIVNATHTLRTITLDCFPLCVDYRGFSNVTQKLFASVTEGLKYQYHNAWSQVLNLLSALFEVMDPNSVYVYDCLASMAALRESNNFRHVAELEYCLGRAIRTFGPEVILKAIPLEINGHDADSSTKRTWLLPVLKENIQSGSLKYFVSEILSVAQMCRKRSDQLASEKKLAASHTFDLLCCQLWALLPSFCNNPTDVAESFRSLAPLLGAQLTSNKNMRLTVMTALRRVIQKSKDAGNEENLKIIGKFAKNFLPILFNIYTTKPNGSDEEGQRLAAIDTIKVYLMVASKELCMEMFDRGFAHLKDDSTDAFMKASVYDLIKTLLSQLDESRLENVYSLSENILQSPKKSTGEEKKAYRLLEHLIACKSEDCQKFIASKVPQIQSQLISSVKSQSAKNAGARLRCLRLLLRILPKNELEVIKTLVPEVVLRCKDANAKTRSTAFNLLVDMFQICQSWTLKPTEDLIKDYFEMLLGGLAGSPAVVSATILGIAHLTFLLRNEMPATVLLLLIETVSLLVADPTREIASAGLDFIKTLLTSFPTSVILPHVPAIVKSILSMTEDCKRHSRLKIRDNLDRLVRKFGHETIRALIPEDDTIMLKRINNLRKLNNRKKKQKQMVEEEDLDEAELTMKTKLKSIDEILASSDESDMENDDEDRTAPKTKNRKNPSTMSMYIKEDEEEIVDLASPAAAANLSARKPAAENSKPKVEKEAPFKVTSTGKLVIPRNIDSGRVTKEVVASDSEDEELEEISSQIKGTSIGGKRKLSSRASSVYSEPASKYQAGGSGIHRPIKKKLKGEDSDLKGMKTGKEYKAKKARGDLKLKGKPDPYAYIPLSRSLLNKRKKAKATGRFKNIIKSAVKGARVGARSKRKTKSK